MTREDEVFDVLLRLAASTGEVGAERVVGETLLEAAAPLFGADGAVMLLDDGSGWLAPVGARGRGAEELAGAALSRGGPAVVAHAGLRPVSFVDAPGAGWPRFASVAREHGIRGVHAVPLVLDGHSLGVLCLLFDEPTTLSRQDAHSAEVVARMAAVGLVNRQEVEEGHHRVAQLQHALDSRVVIEQAKGMISERSGIDPDRAFELIRAAARSTGRPLGLVALDIVTGLGEASHVRGDPPAADRRTTR